MKKYLTRRNVIVAVLVILVTAGTVSYLSRGWIRESAAPSFVAMTSGKDLQNKARVEYNALGQPLEALGYKDIKSKTTCNTIYAKSFHTELVCNFVVEGTLEVTKDSSHAQSIPDKGKQVQSALEQNGWEGTFDDANPSASLHELTSAISKGIDYTPDASYMKRSQNPKQMSCALTNITAFQSPATPAMYSQFNCFKNVDLF